MVVEKLLKISLTISGDNFIAFEVWIWVTIIADDEVETVLEFIIYVTHWNIRILPPLAYGR